MSFDFFYVFSTLYFRMVLHEFLSFSCFFHCFFKKIYKQEIYKNITFQRSLKALVLNIYSTIVYYLRNLFQSLFQQWPNNKFCIIDISTLSIKNQYTLFKRVLTNTTHSIFLLNLRETGSNIGLAKPLEFFICSKDFDSKMIFFQNLFSSLCHNFTADSRHDSAQQ